MEGTTKKIDVVTYKIARAIGTVKRFVTVLDKAPLDDRVWRFRVCHRGGFLYVVCVDMVLLTVVEVYREAL